MKKLIVILAIFLMFPLKGLCACSNAEKEYYKKAAMNVKSTYELIEHDNDVLFGVTALNIVPGMTIKEKNNGYTYKYNNASIIPIGAYFDGDIVELNIYACDAFMRKITIKLPSYNYYSEDPLCDEIEEFELCQRWYNPNMSYKKFKQTVIEYKNSKQPVKEEPKNPVINKINEILEGIIRFVGKYNLIILGVIAAGGIVGIILVNNHEKKFIKIKI